jgi:hypothetical protein
MSKKLDLLNLLNNAKIDNSTMYVQTKNSSHTMCDLFGVHGDGSNDIARAGI